MKRRVILPATREASLSCYKFTESLHMLEADNLDKMKQGSELHTDRNQRDAMTLVHVTGLGYETNIRV